MSKFSRDLTQGVKEAAGFAEGRTIGARVHVVNVPPTRKFGELVQKRVACDPVFGAALLRESIEAMFAGDVDTGKAILCDYIKATVGFEKLGEATGTPPESLIRMLGPRGNPHARNLFGIIGYLKKQAGVELHVTP